ncbi:MAG: hypothetical protein KDK70_23800, partial [Myxococcales bacterium]|nr:hypothetical protein [Myxococcales bacterium]
MIPTTAEVIEGLDVGFELGGQVYVRVHLADRYPGPGEPTLAGLGRDLVVQPQRILAALLSNRAKLRAVNGPALEALFARYNRIPAMSEEHPPSLSRGAKKEHLREQTTNVRGFVRHGTKALRHDEPSYYDWSLPKHLTIAVPLSDGMVDVIETSRRWTAIEAQVDAF